MSWNYRIMRREQAGDKPTTLYGLVEAYYDEDGNLDGWTDSKIGWYDTTDELINDLFVMLRDAWRRPALDKLWTP